MTIPVWRDRTGRARTVADVLSVVSVIVAAIGVLMGGPVAQATMAATLALPALTFLGVSFNLQRRFARESRRERWTPVDEISRPPARCRDGPAARRRWSLR